jgi:hypothetical protein
LYPGGFVIEPPTTGSAYDSSLTPVTGFTSGTVGLSGGNLTSDITNSVTIDARNRVTSDGINGFTLKLNRSRGLFSGSVRDPGTGKRVKFNGAILQKHGFGAGYFSGTNQTGNVSFEH